MLQVVPRFQKWGFSQKITENHLSENHWLFLTLLVELACQCHVGGGLPNLSPACGMEPSRLAQLTYALLTFVGVREGLDRGLKMLLWTVSG